MGRKVPNEDGKKVKRWIQYDYPSHIASLRVLDQILRCPPANEFRSLRLFGCFVSLAWPGEGAGTCNHFGFADTPPQEINHATKQNDYMFRLVCCLVAS